MTSSLTVNGTTYTEPTDFENYQWLITFFAMMEDVLADLNKALVTTSTSSVAIGTGSKSVTLAEDRPFRTGAWVTVTDTANSANYMYGQVTAYDSGTKALTVNVTATGGSGTIASWNVQISGIQGATGTIADGDKGDITVSSSGTVWTIDNGAVTEAKQTLADNTTNNVDTSRHGYVPKAPNDASQFLNGLGNWSGVPYPLMPHRAGGVYYPPANLLQNADSSIAVTNNFLYVSPFIVPATATYTRIAVDVGTAGTGNMRLGIYRDSGGSPDALVLDAGTVDVSSTGVKFITISQSLAAGFYWLAFVAQNSGTNLKAGGSAVTLPMLGMSASGGGSYGALRRSFTYAALPDPYGTMPTGITQTAPWICLYR